MNDEPFPTPFTAGWAEMTQRKMQLARLVNRGLATPAEREELTYLQRRSAEEFRRAFPSVRNPDIPPIPGDGIEDGGLISMGIVAMLVAIVLVACAMIWGCVGTVRGAPAPTYRERPALSRRIEGMWDLQWGSTTGTCVLSRQGFWGATIGGIHWHGSWSLEGTSLTLRERRMDIADADEMTYIVTLADDPSRVEVRGVLAGSSTAFALRP